MAMTLIPRKRSSLRTLWDNWFTARLERRKAYLNHLIPATVSNALAAAILSEKEGGSAYGEMKLPNHLGLSTDGSESFGRLARESSHHVDSLLVQLRIDNPDWYIYTDAHGYDTAFDTIIVRRIKSTVEKLEEAA